MTREIEFLVAWDNETWSIQIETVPEEQTPDEYINGMMQQTRFRSAVLIVVYCEGEA